MGATPPPSQSHRSSAQSQTGPAGPAPGSRCGEMLLRVGGGGPSGSNPCSDRRKRRETTALRGEIPRVAIGTISPPRCWAGWRRGCRGRCSRDVGLLRDAHPAPRISGQLPAAMGWEQLLALLLSESGWAAPNPPPAAAALRSPTCSRHSRDSAPEGCEMRAWISATCTGCWDAPGALCGAVVAPTGMVAAPRWLLWWPWVLFGGPGCSLVALGGLWWPCWGGDAAHGSAAGRRSNEVGMGWCKHAGVALRLRAPGLWVWTRSGAGPLGGSCGPAGMSRGPQDSSRMEAQA